MEIVYALTGCIIGAVGCYGVMRGKVQLAMAEVQAEITRRVKEVAAIGETAMKSAALADSRLDRIGELARENKALSDDLIAVKAERDRLAVKAAKFDNMTDRDEKGRFVNREKQADAIRTAALHERMRRSLGVR